MENDRQIASRDLVEFSYSYFLQTKNFTILGKSFSLVADVSSNRIVPALFLLGNVDSYRLVN